MSSWEQTESVRALESSQKKVSLFSIYSLSYFDKHTKGFVSRFDFPLLFLNDINLLSSKKNRRKHPISFSQIRHQFFIHATA
jgi:hypothetical protein